MDFAELAKPRIATLVLVTVAVGALVASAGHPDLFVLLHTLCGTALVAASASAGNQWLERAADARMQRTANRPLPAGRLSDAEVIAFAGVTLLLGLIQLGWMVGLTTLLLGAATWVLYVAIYTPLKSRTAFNTVVGAVAGALPVLLGWSATGERFTLAAAEGYCWQAR